MRPAPRALALLALVPAACLYAAAAQPNRAALDKAKAKFEADMAKADEGLIMALDKAGAKAKNNKAMADKLEYEREVFVTARIVPTAVPADAYLKQRGKAVAALEAAYGPAVKAAVKGKKDDEAEALEAEWGDLLKSARGYGLAVPDLDAKPVFHIESKASGLVVEPRDGVRELTLAPKAGRRRAGQCWQLEREPKGYVVRNVGNGLALHIERSSNDPGTKAVVWESDRTRETAPGWLFKLTEVRRELVISLAKNDLALTANEKKEKGMTAYTLTQEKKGEPLPANQRWVLVEAK